MNASLQNNIEESNTRHKVKRAIQTIGDELNHSHADVVIDGIIAGLSKQHRTLQQASVKAIIDALIIYGNDESYDDRNEASKRYCQKLDTPNFPYI